MTRLTRQSPKRKSGVPRVAHETLLSNFSGRESRRGAPFGMGTSENLVPDRDRFFTKTGSRGSPLGSGEGRAEERGQGVRAERAEALAHVLGAGLAEDLARAVGRGGSVRGRGLLRVE